MLGTNLTYAKAYNYRLVLEIIRLEGPISRANIARKTELTAQTVTNITRWLLQAGLINEAERHQGGRGAPSTALVINADSAFSIGLDLDQDHLTGVLMDLSGTVRHRLAYSFSFPTPDHAMDLMESCVTTLMEKENLKHENVWGVGIGLPGPFEISDGTVVTNLNTKAFPGWKHVPVVKTMSERLSLPIHLENNATAAAIGECRYGRGQEAGTFFYIFFGLGLGGGLVLDGHPYSGNTGNAGEVGYIPTTPTKTIPSPFTKPHLGIHFNLPLLFEKLATNGLAIEKPSELADLLTQEHPVLMNWIDEGAQLLASLAISIQYILDPEAIFLGGRIPESVLLAFKNRVDQLLPELRVVDTESASIIRLASAGRDAAALGVATIPLHESFSPSHSILAKRVSENHTEPFTPNGHPKIKI